MTASVTDLITILPGEKSFQDHTEKIRSGVKVEVQGEAKVERRREW